MSRKIQINGGTYELFTWNEDHARGISAPHMIDISTGVIPVSKQRTLLREYLLAKKVDIEPWEKRNTYWCIETALKLKIQEQEDEVHNQSNEAVANIDTPDDARTKGQEVSNRDYIIVDNKMMRKGKTNLDKDIIRLYMTYKFSPKSFEAITGKKDIILKYLRTKEITEGSKPWRWIARDPNVGEQFRIKAIAYIESIQNNEIKVPHTKVAKYKPKDSNLYMRLAKRINAQFDTKYYIGDIIVSDAEYLELLGFIRTQMLNQSAPVLIEDSTILAVGLVQIGIRCYNGNYWGNAEKEIGIELNASKQRVLGLSFIKTLKAHDKCILSEKDRVDSILFHSFVSNYYSKGLFEFLFQYFTRDLERDIHRNTTEQMQELMNTIAINAQKDEKLSDKFTEQFESKGSQAYKLRHHTLDAIAANPRHSKLRLHRIIRMIDKAFWNDYLPINPTSRLSILFKEWAVDSDSFVNEYRLYKKGEVKNRGKKHFSTPYLFANIRDNEFSLKLPSQLVKDEYAVELRWKISTCERNVSVDTRTTQAVTGVKTDEESLILNENELLNKIECRLMTGNTLVRHLSDIPASSVRFFDMDGDYAGRLFKIPMCAYTPSSVQLKSLALLDSVQLGRLIRWDFEFEEGDVVLLPDESSMIVGECYNEGLLLRNRVKNAHYKLENNIVSVFSSAPELLMLIPEHQIAGSILDINGSRKRLIECERIQFDSKDSKGKKANVLSLGQFKEHLVEGMNRTILDEPGSTYAKVFNFFLAKGFSATFDGAPYVFDDRGTVSFPNDIIIETDENASKLPDDNTCSFVITCNVDTLQVQIGKERLPVELDIPVFMWSIDGEVWNTAPMGDIWHTKFPNKIFVKSPNTKVEFGIDLDMSDDTEYDLHSVKADAFRGEIMSVDLTRFQSWFSRDKLFYNITLKLGGTEYSFGKVFTKSYVASCIVSADFESNIITCKTDILGDANYYISVINVRTGEILADKVPLCGDNLSIQAKRINGKYLVELFEAEDDDSGFGDIEFYRIYSHSEEMLNKDDLSGKHLNIMMFRPVKHSMLYTKFDHDYWVCNLEKVGSLKYEGELFKDKSPCGTKVMVWFAAKEDLRYFNLSFWDDEYEEYNSFIFDREAKALVKDDDPTLKHAERFRRYRELYDSDYIYYGSLKDSFSGHEEG